MQEGADEGPRCAPQHPTTAGPSIAARRPHTQLRCSPLVCVCARAPLTFSKRTSPLSAAESSEAGQPASPAHNRVGRSEPPAAPPSGDVCGRCPPAQATAAQVAAKATLGTQGSPPLSCVDSRLPMESSLLPASGVPGRPGGVGGGEGGCRLLQRQLRTQAHKTGEVACWGLPGESGEL